MPLLNAKYIVKRNLMISCASVGIYTACIFYKLMVSVWGLSYFLCSWLGKIIFFILFQTRCWVYSASYMYFFSICSICHISHLLVSMCQKRFSDQRLSPLSTSPFYAYIIYSYRLRANVVKIICPWVAIQCIRLTSNLQWNENVCNLKTLVHICIT